MLLSSAVEAATVVVLNETEPDIYAIERLTLSGDLQSNTLRLSGSGEVISGNKTKVYLLGPASDLLVSGLRVNNRPTSVSFDKHGYFFLGEKGDFELSADIAIRTIGQVKLRIPGPVNHLHFALDNGHAIGGDRYGLIDADVIMQRWEKVSMVVDGSFKYTYAERNQFHYLINLQAYGSTLGRYTLELPNGERVTSVTGAVKWGQEGNRLVLGLSDEKASVTIRGYFDARQLRVPLPEDRHHVLVESDPQKKITISTAAEEIDVSESTLPPSYGNARAFIASRSQPITVSVKELDLLPSLAATIDRATQRVAVTDKGSVVGELNYRYKNTGQDYIEVDVPGQPLYASTRNQPIKLTKDETFMLAFPKTSGQGTGAFELVYFTTRDALGVFDVVDVPLAKADIPVSTMQTIIYLPDDVYVIETLGAAGGSELPSLSAAIFYLLIVGGLAGLVKKDKGFITSYLIFSIGLLAFNGYLFLLLLAASIIAVIRRHIKKDQFKMLAGGAGALIAVAIIVIVGFAFLAVIWQIGIFNMGGMSQSVRSTAEYGADYALVEEAPMRAPAMKGLTQLGDGEGAITVPVREGVYPVKLEIPNLGKTISVTNHLVTKESPVHLTVILAAGWLTYLLYLIAALAGTKAYKNYKNQPTEKRA